MRKKVFKKEEKPFSCTLTLCAQLFPKRFLFFKNKKPKNKNKRRRAKEKLPKKTKEKTFVWGGKKGLIKKEKEPKKEK